MKGALARIQGICDLLVFSKKTRQAQCRVQSGLAGLSISGGELGLP